MAALIALAGCSGGGSPAPSLTTSAAPAYDNFQTIGDAIGCLSLINSDPETTDIKDNKYCNLEHPTQKGGGVTVYEYADVARRDKSLKAGLVFEQSFLVLSDTWAINGEVKDLRKIKAVLGTGELRTAEPDASPRADSGVEPGDDEPTLDIDDATLVSLGKSATYQGQRVQAGKVYCNDLKGSKDPNRQFDSCRLSSLSDGYEDHKAPKGQEFYLVAFRWKNTGNEPVAPSDFGNLVTDKGVEYADETELSDSATTNARGNEDFSTSGEMNPGTSGRILLCYAIPKGTKVAKIYWGLDDYSEGLAAYALEVK
ncbi:DUF4352 domain-containing protein [uncultured Friedmanniella sp.]|uniref:DUF4352 domain-containing protein n=1 Tax=uncultured Friedmanniella sp. TaxID=335381 RepID=UPI0035CB6984